MVVNVDKYVNILVVFILFVLVEVVEEGCMKVGDIILMVGFGGGLIWGVFVFVW